MWWAAAAWAVSPVPQAELDRMVAELAPVVSEVGGRPLLPVAIEWASRDELAERFSRPEPWIGSPREPGDLDEARAAAARALAAYLPALRTIEVAEDTDGLLAQVPDDQVRPILRCAVAHELVHALQDQYAFRSGGWSTLRQRSADALAEGHATLIGLEVCARTEGPEFEAAFERIMKLGEDLDWSDVPGPLLPYFYGRWTIRGLRQLDPELVWAALRDRPPNAIELAGEVDRSLAQARGALGVLGPILERLGQPATALRPDASLGEILGDPSAPRDGWGGSAEGVRLLAYGVDRLGDAERLVAERRRDLVRGRANPLLAGAPGRWAVKGRRGSFVASDGGGFELWASGDHVVLAVASRGPSADPGPLAPLVAEATARLGLVGPPDPVSPSSIPGVWLSELREHLPSVAPVTSPAWRYGDAARAWARGDPAPCPASFDEVLAPGVVGDPTPWAQGALRCAVDSSDLAYASRAAAGLGSIPADDGSLYVRMLLDAHRPEEALDALARVESTSDRALESTIASLQQEALRGAGR